MIDVENLRRRIGQEFENACRLTADEARRVFDVYEAACAWRDRLTTDGDGRTWGDNRDWARLTSAVDAARSTP